MNAKTGKQLLGEFGFLTFAFSHEKYMRQAEALALSLNRYMPTIKIALVTDLQPPSGVFDEIVPINTERGKSFLQKLWIDDYSPFERTLFIDADCLAGAPFHEELENLRRYHFTPVCERYLWPGQIDENGWVRDIGKALSLCGGDRLPKFNGGVYYFDRSDEARAVFLVSRKIAKRAVDFGLDRANGKEPGDEPIFALALASLGLLPLYNDQARLMRTPIGIKGKIAMDRTFGSFRFEKNGKTVKPAICHFARDSTYRMEYLLASSFARRGKVTIGATLAATATVCAWKLRVKLPRIARRLHGYLSILKR